MEHRAVLKTVDTERRLFGGWAYRWRDTNGDLIVDHSGDFIDTPEAEEAFVDAFTDYALESRAGDDGHRDYNASTLVGWLPMTDEIAKNLELPTDYRGRGVFVLYKALDTPAGEALWQRIKKGERQMLSIVGAGEREEV